VIVAVVSQATTATPCVAASSATAAIMLSGLGPRRTGGGHQTLTRARAGELIGSLDVYAGATVVALGPCVFQNLHPPLRDLEARRLQ
jgi:hypothetical protein